MLERALIGIIEREKLNQSDKANITPHIEYMEKNNIKKKLTGRFITLAEARD